jgi:hypothetical protein
MDTDPTSPAARGERHRFAILSDPASAFGSPTPLTERAAANRRDLLDHLDELAAVIAAPGGPAGEGINPRELARTHPAALRLAAAADAALTDQAPTREARP